MRTRMLVVLAVLLGAGFGLASSAVAVEAEGRDKQCWYRPGVDEENSCAFCGDPCLGEADGWKCCSISVE